MQIIQLIIFSILSYWISGLVHEAGHLVVGLLNGWKFHLLVVGPLGFKVNEQGKVVAYFEKNMLLWGGVGAALPQTNDPTNLAVWKKVLVGGPAASMVMGLTLLPIGMVADNVFLLLLGAMPLGMGLACGLPLPLKTGILYTDGGRLARLNSTGQTHLEEKALFTLTQSSICSAGFQNVPYSDIEHLMQSKDNAIKYYGYYYSYRYFSEKDNSLRAAEAIELMEGLKNSVSKLIVEDCKIECVQSP